MDLSAHPGLLYVVVTLLPLASFLVLFLAGGLRQYLRSYRETAPGEALYNLLGGDMPSRWPAYVATAAIGIAFVLSLVGFIQYTSQHPELEQTKGNLQKRIYELEAAKEEPKETRSEEELEAEIKPLEHEIEELEARWTGHFSWLKLRLPSLNDPERGTTLQLGYKIDSLSATMFLMVTFVAALIHLFSIGYMSEELQPTVEDHHVHVEHGHLHRRGRFGRFFMFLSLFCFSMLNLVLADNLFQVFVSWELVGICSYLLIGFYYERRSAADAANKAFITNRVGDAGFIVGLLIIWTYIGTFNFEEIFQRLRAPVVDTHGHGLRTGGMILRANEVGKADGGLLLDLAADGSQVLLLPREPGHIHDYEYDPELYGPSAREGKRLGSFPAYYSPKPTKHGTMPYWVLVVAGLGVFLGCVGKSAQFPLHVWLPDAMEGPTPVSALIHAATMVAAGVYLVGRCFPLFTLDALLVIAYTGGITLFVAASIAVVMTDIKKVLAYSTVSQLGYMMLALGVGGWVAGLFHLLTHAFFKALLFLGSGSVIHGCHHEQEISKMGGLYGKMKVTALTMLVGVLAIAGIPLFSGWYSKDAILAQALGFIRAHPEHSLLFLLPLLGAGLTAFYMFRMWFLTFTGRPRDEHVYEHAHESPWLMTLPLIVLAVCSVFVAWGMPPWKAENSWLEHHLHHSMPDAVMADFGNVPLAPEEHGDKPWLGLNAKPHEQNERLLAHESHDLAGLLALGLVALGISFSAALYYYRVLDPTEGMESFPVLHRLLVRKWYFDELYSVLLVRPALVVAHWCRAFDTYVIDGAIHLVAWLTAWASRVGGLIDRYVVDGLVNLLADVCYGVGGRLRTVQTGNLRSYIVFLALAAVGVFAVLAYFVRMAAAAG